MGEPCQILIHVITTPEGTLEWLLVDVVPNATPSEKAEPDKFVHKFKRAEPTAELIRHTEAERLALSDGQAVWRHAVTCGDGAYVGPYSNQLVETWCGQVLDHARLGDAPAAKHLQKFARGDGGSAIGFESSCEFHIIQLIGRDVDSKFPVAQQFDDLLRFFQHRYSFGAQKLIVRAVARRLGQRLKKLLAPRSDGFKVTGYSRRGAERYVYHFQLLHLALQCELQLTYLNARADAQRRYEEAMSRYRDTPRVGQKAPRVPRPDVGHGLALCKTLRSIGRQMLDVRVLLFGLGRGDLRDRFLAGYSVMTQDFRVSALVKVHWQHELILSMQRGVRGISTLAGALSMLRT
jgi:hypothetical protein